MANVGIIIQARLSSTRLPRKTEKPFTDNLSLLEACVSRAKKSGYPCIVAAPDDEKHEEYWKSFRACELRFGDPQNLLRRYLSVGKSAGFDVLVRLTGDNPFMSWEVAVETVNFLLAHHLEYVTSKGDDGAWLPLGIGCEVFTTQGLEKVVDEADPMKFEHVSESFLGREDIRSAVLFQPFEWLTLASRHFSLTVDTPSQFLMAKMCIGSGPWK